MKIKIKYSGKWFVVIWLVLLAPNLFSQSVLNDYVEEGLQNNLLIKEKSISLEKSFLALKNAKTYFLPSADLGINYNLANGGRIIALPVGDLLNGVYSSLNTLLDQQQFPQLDNIEEQFLPNNFYDARVRVSYPILNKDLYYNKSIQKEAVLLQEYEIKVFAAELTKNIKQAYYNYCLAYTAIEILENSRSLVAQNVKDNQSLQANGKALPAQVLRAESELENIQSQLIEAENKLKNAGYYVNFLINRPLETHVIFEKILPEVNQHLSLLQVENSSSRAEILKLRTATNIGRLSLRSKQNYALPTLNAFVDLGLQGFDFEVNDQSRYYLFGLQLSMPLFQGGRNKNAVQGARLNLQTLDLQSELLTQQVDMAVKTAQNTIIASHAAKKSAEANLNASTAYLRLIDKGYKEGVNSLIEFIDARNQYTNAALKVSVANYSLLNAMADLERELTQVK
ncbi:TolC family protein [Marivirga lumbricoides]|uniref:TolC family protein n=1 Tax=Marivirga lumbricoides TaxID=1046115 RepID=A0A2T4DKC4_9BACT|nr:TolC family protein [Marivirga lumbricoides]